MELNNELWENKWAKTAFEAISLDHDLSKMASPNEPRSSLWCASLSEPLGKEFKEGMCVLDYGCGLGRYCNFISKRLRSFKYYGLEPSGSIRIKECRKALSDQRANFDYIGSPTEQKALKEADAIIIGSVFTHLSFDAFKKIFEKFLPVLKRGGKVIFSCFVGDEYKEIENSDKKTHIEKTWEPSYKYRVFYTLKQINKYAEKKGIKINFVDSFSSEWHQIFEATTMAEFNFPYQGMSAADHGSGPGRPGFHGRKIGDQWVLTNTRYRIRRDVMELNLTDDCNLACPNCQSACPTAPSKDYLQIEDLEKFVEDTLSLEIKWTEVKLTGGEPTLHPLFHRMIHELKKCNTQIRIFTNSTPHAKKMLESVKKDVKITSQFNAETKNWLGFESAQVAPVDLPEYKDIDENIYTYGCQRLANKHGPTLGTDGKYYFCPTLYHVDRVFKLQTGVPSLKHLMEMSDEEIRNHFLKKACRYCGFFKYPRDAVTEQILSPSWEKALKEYNSQPKLVNLDLSNIKRNVTNLKM